MQSSLIVLAALLASAAPHHQGGDWQSVQKLRSGTELSVTLRGSSSVDRYFIAADDSTLTLLNLTGPMLTDAVRQTLRDVARSHPGYFAEAERAHEYLLDQHVRLGPDGVFVGDVQVARLADVIERPARIDVDSIRTPRHDSNPIGCGAAGYFGGAIIGGLPGVLIGDTIGQDTGPALLGMVIGWAAGAVYLYHKCRHTPERTVYTADRHLQVSQSAVERATRRTSRVARFPSLSDAVP